MESRELGTCQHLCLCLHVPLTDNEGSSISYDKFYTHSSVLYSPDFSRCSLGTCIRDFMIFRAVRIPLPFLSEARQLQHKHENKVRGSLFPSMFSGNRFLLPVLFISPSLTLLLLPWSFFTLSNTPRFKAFCRSQL